MRVHRGWKAQDLIRREEVIDILQTNLQVASHPIPENMAGVLYCVSGASNCADAIMDLIEMRALQVKKREESEGLNA